MEKKAPSGIMLTLMLMSMLTLAFETKPVASTYSEKSCMPDFGQHSTGWCWVGAAANAFYYWGMNGYPGFLDNATNGIANDNELNNIDPNSISPGNAWYCVCGNGYKKLLSEICKAAGLQFCNMVQCGQFTQCLTNFINSQGLSGEFMVPKHTSMFQNTTLKQLKNWFPWGVVLLRLDPPTAGHIVTCFAYDDVAMQIKICDPWGDWTLGTPDHNNNPDLKAYHTCPVTFAGNATNKYMDISHAGAVRTVTDMWLVAPKLKAEWKGDGTHYGNVHSCLYSPGGGAWVPPILDTVGYYDPSFQHGEIGVLEITETKPVCCVELNVSGCTPPVLLTCNGVTKSVSKFHDAPPFGYEVISFDIPPSSVVTIYTGPHTPTDDHGIGIKWVKLYYTAHDVGIESVESKTVVGQGSIANVTVATRNYGDYTEDFSVIAYANSTVIESKTITLASRASTTTTLKWDTTGFAKGGYTLSVKIPKVSGETDTTDNTFADGTVLVTIPGDVNGDKKVDGKDIALCAKYFGKPASNYPNADINNDGKIDGKDIAITAKNFGKSWT